MVAFQVVPPSVETSTRATTPPPVSAAVPVMVTGRSAGTVALGAGLATVMAGPVVSVEAVDATRLLCRDLGWTPMSAKTLTVACCIRLSSVTTASSGLPVGMLVRPQDHCTVPAPKTRACEVWSRKATRLCVAVPFPYVLP